MNPFNRATHRLRTLFSGRQSGESRSPDARLVGVPTGAGTMNGDLLGASLIVLTALCSPGTVSAANAIGPASCPPVERVAFERDGAVWVLDAEAKPRRVASGGCPALAPDGTRIAYCAASGRLADAGPDTVASRALADGPEQVWLQGAAGDVVGDLVWSPDGKRLAFLHREASGTQGVRLVDTAAGAAVALPLARGTDDASLWGLAWAPDSRSLVAHDMRELIRFALDGRILDRVTLPELTGARIETVTSADRFVPSPRDGGLFAYTGSVPGTARFEAVMHEPNTALFLHDRWLGRGKNLRLTGKEVTAFDPVWSPDGEHVYFTGYRDTQARETYPFRVLRVHRTGRDLREVARGERPSVARTTPASCRPAGTSRQP